ncbi:hypothetical protein [Pedobacter psychrodurus]|uniref:hypothetical protein n=1 Tax=Pedobacter psychrodurus TaxID=2530456 RepID=UPI0029314EF0|nr:hypothetical protein [Pedobacter psychrodurus]
MVYQNNTSAQYTFLARAIEHAKTNTTKEINMIVINGIPFSTDDFNKIKIENNSIKNIQHLKVDSLGIQSCFGQQGDILLIRTN